MDSMQLLRYWRIVRKRWWLILLLTIVGTASATYYTITQPPIYRSTTTLLLSPASNQGSLLPGATTDTTQQLAQTYNHYLKTTMFAELVIQREQLALTPAELVNSVSAEMIEGTQFFAITAMAHDPNMAQQLVSAIANNFIQENQAQQRKEVAARRAAGDVGDVQTVLTEKLERERQYYESQVTQLREAVQSITNNQRESAARDELLAKTQAQLSEYEDRLMQVMKEQVALQPQIDEKQLNAVTIVEPASLPTQPENNQGTRNIAYALVASLLLGMGLAFAFEYFDYTVNAPEELEELVGYAPLGVLGLLHAGSGSAGKKADNPWQDKVADEMVVLTEPRSPIAEALRALRTNLQFSGAGRQLHSLVVTSAGPGEGKSTVAANLAVLFAQGGYQVILVDGDLRRPSQHRLFKISKNIGLSSLLIAEKATDADVIKQHLQPGPIESLRILAAGPIPPNPAELLSAHWTAEIYAALAAQADLVIWDAPPVLTVTDAAILAVHVDATLQVVKAGETRRDLIVKTRTALEQVGARVLAPVLNRVKAHNVGYYQYYYYRYGKYGAGYGEEEPKQKQKSGRHSRRSPAEVQLEEGVSEPDNSTPEVMNGLHPVNGAVGQPAMPAALRSQSPLFRRK